ncbi:hypothetical protein AVEN_53037-1 [Araneus ventricosus]|uniref:CCHC-type domain-containing protein n=1 Tax=Araneus ventricosus TaxID=182803 RepID=A0A4Y2MG92_ARAVE|nr:hypothetical protein AVEN_53037-1 [Araneus ventricosus]
MYGTIKRHHPLVQDASHRDWLGVQGKRRTRNIEKVWITKGGDKKKDQTPVEEILKKELSKLDFHIQNIKKVQNKGLHVVCDEEEDILKLVTSNTDKEDLAAKIDKKATGKRHQGLIVYDIPNSTTEEELQQAIVDRLVLPIPLKLRFKLRRKEQDTSHWFVEAPGEAIKKIERTRKLALKWTMHNVREFFHLKRCTKCQGFGHLVKDCKDVRFPSGSYAGRHETRRYRSPQLAIVMSVSTAVITTIATERNIRN